MTVIEVLGWGLIVLGAGLGMFVVERIRYEWRALREQKKRPVPEWGSPFEATTTH